MDQSDQFDNYNNENNGTDTISDTYTTESSADIYNTPDISGSPLNDTPAEEIVDADVISEEKPVDAAGLDETPLEVISEADTVIEDAVIDQSNSTPQENYMNDSAVNPYGMSVNNNTYYSDPYANDPYNNPYNNLYGGQPAQNNGQYSNPYENNPYSGQNVQNNSLYVGQPAQKNGQYSNPYENNPYGGQNMQNNIQYAGQPAQNNGQYGNPYENNPYGYNPYGGQNTQNSTMYGGQNMQNSIPYGEQPAENDDPYNNPYGYTPYGGQQNSTPYGGQNTQNSAPYGGQNMQNSIPYGGQPAQNSGQYGNNQYSPYAVPPKKNNTGLIIGIVVAVIMLFLIALGALTYKVVSLYSEEKDNKRSVREEYNFDDDESDKDRNYKDNDRYHDDDRDYDYDHDNDYDYDYDDDYNYDDDEYYTLHDDIKNNLSYSVDFDYYEYDTDYENVDIMVFYPVISNKDGDVPNLDKLNSTIQSEVDFLVDYFEDEYEQYFVDDDESYFQASSTGYVTYMDEEKLSIVFSENVYSDYYNDVFLYSINIDMENGVILDNESMLNVNDDFSVEFREKSDIQNGEISYLTRMSDQEITDHFDSTDIIVFYTPQGMEIGFNYDEGWVTVTYKDYEKYLKVF